tara:strand:- start:386 stop:931 length:546 start_codon:yes stop_codon:yes gene_type:complete
LTKSDGDTAAIDWPADIYGVLSDMAVRQVCYVPDAGHKRLLEMCRADNAMTMVSLTTEEEGMAVLGGAWLGGQRGVMLMQSSGVGNCINAIASITRAASFPLLMLVTMRGEWGEFNPWQIPMGRATPPVLETMGCTVMRADRPADVKETVLAGARLAFDAGAPVAVLLGQRLIGTKAFKEE